MSLDPVVALNKVRALAGDAQFFKSYAAAQKPRFPFEYVGLLDGDTVRLYDVKADNTPKATFTVSMENQTYMLGDVVTSQAIYIDGYLSPVMVRDEDGQVSEHQIQVIRMVDRVEGEYRFYGLVGMDKSGDPISVIYEFKTGGESFFNMTEGPGVIIWNITVPPLPPPDSEEEGNLLERELYQIHFVDLMVNHGLQRNEESYQRILQARQAAQDENSKDWREMLKTLKNNAEIYDALQKIHSAVKYVRYLDWVRRYSILFPHLAPLMTLPLDTGRTVKDELGRLESVISQFNLKFKIEDRPATLADLADLVEKTLVTVRSSAPLLGRLDWEDVLKHPETVRTEVLEVLEELHRDNRKAVGLLLDARQRIRQWSASIVPMPIMQIKRLVEEVKFQEREALYRDWRYYWAVSRLEFDQDMLPLVLGLVEIMASFFCPPAGILFGMMSACVSVQEAIIKDALSDAEINVDKAYVTQGDARMSSVFAGIDVVFSGIDLLGGAFDIAKAVRRGAPSLAGSVDEALSAAAGSDEALKALDELAGSAVLADAGKAVDEGLEVSEASRAAREGWTKGLDLNPTDARRVSPGTTFHEAISPPAIERFRKEVRAEVSGEVLDQIRKDYAHYFTKRLKALESPQAAFFPPPRTFENFALQRYQQLTKALPAFDIPRLGAASGNERALRNILEIISGSLSAEVGQRVAHIQSLLQNRVKLRKGLAQLALDADLAKVSKEEKDLLKEVRTAIGVEKRVSDPSEVARLLQKIADDPATRDALDLILEKKIYKPLDFSPAKDANLSRLYDATPDDSVRIATSALENAAQVQYFETVTERVNRVVAVINNPDMLRERLIRQAVESKLTKYSPRDKKLLGEILDALGVKGLSPAKRKKKLNDLLQRVEGEPALKARLNGIIDDEIIQPLIQVAEKAGYSQEAGKLSSEGWLFAIFAQRIPQTARWKKEESFAALRRLLDDPNIPAEVLEAILQRKAFQSFGEDLVIALNRIKHLEGVFRPAAGATGQAGDWRLVQRLLHKNANQGHAYEVILISQIVDQTPPDSIRRIAAGEEIHAAWLETVASHHRDRTGNKLKNLIDADVFIEFNNGRKILLDAKWFNWGGVDPKEVADLVKAGPKAIETALQTREGKRAALAARLFSEMDKHMAFQAFKMKLALEAGLVETCEFWVSHRLFNQVVEAMGTSLDRMPSLTQLFKEGRLRLQAGFYEDLDAMRASLRRLSESPPVLQPNPRPFQPDPAVSAWLAPSDVPLVAPLPSPEPIAAVAETIRVTRGVGRVSLRLRHAVDDEEPPEVRLLRRSDRLEHSERMDQAVTDFGLYMVKAEDKVAGRKASDIVVNGYDPGILTQMHVELIKLAQGHSKIIQRVPPDKHGGWLRLDYTDPPNLYLLGWKGIALANRCRVQIRCYRPDGRLFRQIPPSPEPLSDGWTAILLIENGEIFPLPISGICTWTLLLTGAVEGCLPLEILAVGEME